MNGNNFQKLNTVHKNQNLRKGITDQIQLVKKKKIYKPTQNAHKEMKDIKEVKRPGGKNKKW